MINEINPAHRCLNVNICSIGLSKELPSILAILISSMNFMLSQVEHHKLIIHMDSEPSLLVRACIQLGQFLQHRETNLR